MSKTYHYELTRVEDWRGGIGKCVDLKDVEIFIQQIPSKRIILSSKRKLEDKESTLGKTND